MQDKFRYRLSSKEKNEIACNLIDILEKDIEITYETEKFVGNWILSGPGEKVKAFYDVWEIVLKNYLPSKRPILFRSCTRVSKNGKIASFTSSLKCVRRFSDEKGTLIICDTKETLELEDRMYKTGEYKNTFYPLVDVLKKAKREGGWGFSDYLLGYIGEEEYIMKVNLDEMSCLKWR